MLAHTSPRQIPAAYVREGDELATYTGTGMLASSPKGASDANWRHEIVWLDVASYDFADGSIRTADGQAIKAGFDEHVVVRERVSVDC